jgi:hypothetical protein
MCGTFMRLKHTQTFVRVLGNPTPVPQTNAEWVCPECDYFEEAEEKST